MKATPVTTPAHLDVFTRAYLQCAAWSSTHTPLDEDGDELEPVDIDDEMNAGRASWAPETIAAAKRDCTKFQNEAGGKIYGHESDAGHDFWLTRNGHGAGFWDGDWPEHGEALTALSKTYGECWLYIGDDGLVRFM